MSAASEAWRKSSDRQERHSRAGSHRVDAGDAVLSVTGTQQFTLGEGQERMIRVGAPAGVPVGTLMAMNAQGQAVPLTPGAAPVGVLMNAPNADGLAEVQIGGYQPSVVVHNHYDPTALLAALETPNGRRVIRNILRRAGMHAPIAPTARTRARRRKNKRGY